MEKDNEELKPEEKLVEIVCRKIPPEDEERIANFKTYQDMIDYLKEKSKYYPEILDVYAEGSDLE